MLNFTLKNYNLIMWPFPVSFGGFFTSAISAATPSQSSDGFVNKADGTLDMSSNKIINLAQPLTDNDAATKKYVDSVLRDREGSALEKNYQRIKTTYNPTFWISSKFPYGFDGKSSSIQDLSGTGLTINSSSVERDLILNQNVSIHSNATYSNNFTFFIKAKKTGGNGRLFTAENSNMLVGWWENQIRCAWMKGEIYGMFSNKTNEDNQIHTFILTNENDKKRFFEDKAEYILTHNGDSAWNGKVIVGRPSVYSNEATTGQFYEVLCFDKVIEDRGIIYIFDTIFA